MAKPTDMKEIYQKFKVGDHISDLELHLLIEDTKKAIDSLDYRSEFGIATSALYKDLASLEGFQRARESNK